MKGQRPKKNCKMQWRRRQSEANCDLDKFIGVGSSSPATLPQISQNGIVEIPSPKLIPFGAYYFGLLEIMYFGLLEIKSDALFQNSSWLLILLNCFQCLVGAIFSHQLSNGLEYPKFKIQTTICTIQHQLRVVPLIFLLCSNFWAGYDHVQYTTIHYCQALFLEIN